MDERQFHDRFYDREAERIFSSRLYRILLDRHVEFLIDVTPVLADTRILSIGCGDGRRELALARHAGSIVGIDVSPVAIRKACELARQSGIENVDFRVDDGSELERRFPAHFDAIVCPGVLHHLNPREIDALLQSARGALKTGGRFVSMDPNALRAVNLLKPLIRHRYDKYHSPDERELSPDFAAARLRSNGFIDIEIRYTDWFISPLAWVFPRLTAPVAPLLALLDQLLVRAPVIKRAASGFAAIARRDE